jgi:3-hydroxyacyl-[acyl-carrier-protein] dehydratase
MRFALIDRITHVEPGQTITAVKNLSMAEEYLADHFPGFPVLPGVLMLEAMVQAGAWLIRVTEDFAHSIILLSETQAVKYGSFVEPGTQLVVTARISEHGPTRTKLTKLKAEGRVGSVSAVSGRLVLDRFNLADRDPALGRADELLIEELRRQYSILYHPAQAVAVGPDAGG